MRFMIKEKYNMKMKRYTQEEFDSEYKKRYEQWKKEGSAGLINFRDSDLRGLAFRDQATDNINFQGSDLRGANFEFCTFTEINFSKTDLRGANFSNATCYCYDEGDVTFEDADLRGACFNGTGFEGVNFSGANLSGAEAGDWHEGACFDRANFRAANLKGVCFCDCEFQNADFSYADFTGAALKNSDFKNAILIDTIFDETNISGSNFEYAMLCDGDRGIFAHRIYRGLKGIGSAENSDNFCIPMSCPSHGSFIGWYGTFFTFENNDCFGILKFEIPLDARRSSAEDEKCRCDKAKLLRIQDIFGHDMGVSEASISNGSEKYTFALGQITEAKDYEENRFKDGPGIPFYIDYGVMMTKLRY